MKKKESNFKINLIYGLLTVVPIAVVLLLLVKMVEILELVGKQLGLESNLGTGAVVLLALVFLLAVVYLFGALVRTRIGSWTHEKLEQKVLLQIPGYNIVSSVLKGFVETNDDYLPVMIRLYDSDTAVLGFAMERNDDDSITVFVPSTPVMTMGNVYIVAPERVTPLDANHIDVVSSITDWGVGTNKVIGNKKTDVTGTDK